MKHINHGTQPSRAAVAGACAGRKKNRSAAAQEFQDRAAKTAAKRPLSRLFATVAAVALLAVSALTACSPVSTAGGAVTFVEKEVENAARVILDRPLGDIYAGELAEISELFLSERGISRLDDLVYFTGLTHLDLSSNDISDISPLAGLKKLTVLKLVQSSIGGQLSVLSSLTSLTELVVVNCGITDISPLVSLTNLKRLGLTTNSISDLSPLAEMSGLTELFLRETGISDVTLLASLSNLEQLDLSNITSNLNSRQIEKNMRY